MKLRVLLSAMLLILGFSVQADNTQMELALQIEEMALTPNQSVSDVGEDPNGTSGVGFTLYPPIIHRNEMKVNGCDVILRVASIHDQNLWGDPFIEITFDLARTRIPDASVTIGNEFSFVAGSGDDPNSRAMFELYFLTPYEPLLWSKTSIGEGEQPVSFTRFTMDPVADETQPRRLLALLNKYQDEYCTFSG